jgi:ABC-type lipoprotein export system ATPase subunit
MQLRNFCFPLAGHDYILFENLDLSPGLHLLYGVSGSGKTTFLEFLAGHREGGHGIVEVGGVEFALHDLEQAEVLFREKISIQYQEPLLIDEMTVEENLNLPGRLMSRDSLSYLESFKIQDSLGLFSLLDRKPASLSRGEEQRVALARALIHSREVLLLDEPLVFLQENLVQKALKMLLDQIQKRKLTCLLATHDPALTTSNLWDSKLIFDQGFFGKIEN